MKTRISLLILLFWFAGSTCFAAEEHEEKVLTPEQISGITTITADVLASLISEGKDLIIIDARIQKGRSKGYIVGSIHLPDIETSCDTLAKIIPSKSTKVVFYCSSSMCGRSMNAVTEAQKCNYTNLYWFRGGFKDWKNSGYPYEK